MGSQAPESAAFWAGSYWQLAPGTRLLDLRTGVCGEKCFNPLYLQLWIHSNTGFWSSHRVRTWVSSKPNVLSKFCDIFSKSRVHSVLLRFEWLRYAWRAFVNALQTGLITHGIRATFRLAAFQPCSFWAMGFRVFGANLHSRTGWRWGRGYLTKNAPIDAISNFGFTRTQVSHQTIEFGLESVQNLMFLSKSVSRRVLNRLGWLKYGWRLPREGF